MVDLLGLDLLGKLGDEEGGEGGGEGEEGEEWHYLVNQPCLAWLGCGTWLKVCLAGLW